jgi:hypothetical protein
MDSLDIVSSSRIIISLQWRGGVDPLIGEHASAICRSPMHRLGFGQAEGRAR